MMENLLIVDDSEEIRNQLKWGLGKEYILIPASDMGNAISLFRRHQPKVVTLDLGLPPYQNSAEDGLRCLEEIIRIDPFSKVIVITGNNEKENALKAIQSGAYDYYQKPIELSELKIIIKRAFHVYNLEKENKRLQDKLEKKAWGFGGIVGQCQQMLEIFSTIKKIATFDVPVLIQGESGTGKEMVARALHSMSLRKNESFIPINCGAIPESLMESELFGYEKGAFTGADMKRKGRLEYAEKGTLFLDEIGDLSLSLQVKLLRFLQDHTIERLGGGETIPLDIRIIAATNKDIKRDVECGKFREDLYFRLSVVTISIPPLRDRGDDIYLLAKSFLNHYNSEFKRDIKGFSNKALLSLGSHDWPGNIRELENRVKRAIVMADGGIITPKDLDIPYAESKEDSISIPLREARDKVEKEVIHKALLKHSGVVIRAAEELRVTRQTLTDLIKKHDITTKS
jgi:two-component system NtrC family response regulator